MNGGVIVNVNSVAATSPVFVWVPLRVLDIWDGNELVNARVVPLVLDMIEDIKADCVEDVEELNGVLDSLFSSDDVLEVLVVL